MKRIAEKLVWNRNYTTKKEVVELIIFKDLIP